MVVTRSQARRLNIGYYNDLIDRVPGIDTMVQSYVGAVRNGYTYEQLLAPCILKKQAAVAALNDWYENDREVYDIYYEHMTTQPLILLIVFDIWLHGLLELDEI